MMPSDSSIPALVRQVDSLSELAGQINAEHESGMEATRNGIIYFRQVGAMLRRAKAKCGHGQWLSWVAKNLAFSDRQARKYMQLDREWDQVKSELSSDLTGAFRILTNDTRDHDDDSDSSARRSNSAPVAEEHPFADLLAAVTGTARRISETIAGDSEEAKKLRDYLSWAGLVEHKGAKIEGAEYHDATATFLPLKGVRKLIDLARYPGRKTAEEIRKIYDEASGGWIPPITLRRRNQRKGR